MYAVHSWAVTQQLGLWSGDQKLGVPLQLSPKSHCGLGHRQRGTLFYTEPPNAKNTQKKTCTSFPAAQIQPRRKAICGKSRPFSLSRPSRQTFLGLNYSLTVSLDHRGRTCSSCDSNEGMALLRHIANKTQFCLHCDTHSTSLRLSG